MTQLQDLDARTREVRWSRGLAIDPAANAILLSAEGGKVIVVGEAMDHRPPRILVFKRGAPPDPVWTGTVHGTIRGIPKGWRTEPITVTVGDASTKADSHGHYELKVSARGTLHVETDLGGAGINIESPLIDPAPGHTSYEANLKVTTFRQSCGG
jgi:hypothetical protein